MVGTGKGFIVTVELIKNEADGISFIGSPFSSAYSHSDPPPAVLLNDRVGVPEIGVKQRSISFEPSVKVNGFTSDQTIRIFLSVAETVT